MYCQYYGMGAAADGGAYAVSARAGGFERFVASKALADW